MSETKNVLGSALESEGDEIVDVQLIVLAVEGIRQGGRVHVNAKFCAKYLSFFCAILENLMSMGCVVS